MKNKYDEDPYGRSPRMTREEFNRIMRRTLHTMGDKDPEAVEYEPEWEEEYDAMKYFTPKQFQDLCDAGIQFYKFSKKSDYN